jgi:hypothetical protein
MKPYLQYITNTGGNDIEELVNDDGTNSNVFNNVPPTPAQIRRTAMAASSAGEVLPPES